MKKLSFLVALFVSQYAISEPLYKIPDNDVKELIDQMNQYEQCLYPEIKKANGDPEKLEQIYSKMNEKIFLGMTMNEVFAMNMELVFLPNVIGQDNTKALLNDPESLQYFESRYEALNHSTPVEKTDGFVLYHCSETQRALGSLEALNLRTQLKQESRKNRKPIDCKSDPLAQLNYYCQRETK